MTVGLRIREIRIVVETVEGPFGFDVQLKDGLTVLRADNTSGKSTAMKAILYGLGLEGMLGPSHSPPFPPAVTDELEYDRRKIEVKNSEVQLSVENSHGQRLRLSRPITGEGRQRELIRTTLWLDAESQGMERDFYVRTKGAAQAASGFHKFLAGFMGLDLPKVASAQSGLVPLYLECIFPFFFVDQSTGWRDIKARMPTHLQIPEMTKRAAEYVLGLDVLKEAVRRQLLEQEKESLEQQWKQSVQEAKYRFQGTGTVLRGLGEEPHALSTEKRPLELFATDGEKWIEAETALQQLAKRLEELADDEDRRKQVVEEEGVDTLRRVEERAVELRERYDVLLIEASGERSEVKAIDRKLAGLREDLARYEDQKRLSDRQGEIQKLKVANGSCPACGQDIRDMLLPQDRPTNPMSIEANIVFIRDQIRTFEEMREESRQSLVAKEEQLDVLRTKVIEENALVKTQRRLLKTMSPGPSIAMIQERLQIETRIELIKRAQEDVAGLVEKLQPIYDRWKEIKSQLKEDSSGSLSVLDKQKLDQLSKLFVQQLAEYGFGSFELDEVRISEATYRPSHREYDLGWASASDTIRVIWAYLIAILELARSFETNHIGMLVFDEPRQQGTAEVSFDALMKRASTSAKFGQQVIVATSEREQHLEPILSGIECTYLRFSHKFLVPLTKEQSPPAATA